MDIKNLLKEKYNLEGKKNINKNTDIQFIGAKKIEEVGSKIVKRDPM